jgi:hypothetical protein
MSAIPFAVRPAEAAYKPGRRRHKIGYCHRYAHRYAQNRLLSPLCAPTGTRPRPAPAATFNAGPTGGNNGPVRGPSGGGRRGKRQPKKQCPAIPTPGAGKDSLDANIRNAQKRWPFNSPLAFGTGSMFDLLEQSEVVTSSQNYKSFIEGAAAYGNFNYGATMQARGFSLAETLEWSDTFQVATTKRSDPPEDVRDVTNGYQYAANECYAKNGPSFPGLK